MAEHSCCTTPDHCYKELTERSPTDVAMQFRALAFPAKEWLLEAKPYEIEVHVKGRMEKGLDLLGKPHVFTSRHANK